MQNTNQTTKSFMPNPDMDTLLTALAMAEALGLDVDALLEAAREGALEEVRVGVKKLILEKDVEDLTEEIATTLVEVQLEIVRLNRELEKARAATPAKAAPELAHSRCRCINGRGL